LRQNLQAAGIEPADVDTVVITHAHPAHVGGTLDDEGQPVYASARYYLGKEEWEFWTSEHFRSGGRDRGLGDRPALLPLPQPGARGEEWGGLAVATVREDRKDVN